MDGNGHAGLERILTASLLHQGQDGLHNGLAKDVVGADVAILLDGHGRLVLDGAGSGKVNLQIELGIERTRTLLVRVVLIVFIVVFLISTDSLARMALERPAHTTDLAPDATNIVAVDTLGILGQGQDGSHLVGGFSEYSMEVLLQALVEDVVGERRVALEVDAGRRGSVLLAPKEEGTVV